MSYVDSYILVSTVLLTFFFEYLSHQSIFSNSSKIYYFLARLFGWKKLKEASKYPKAIKTLKDEISNVNSKEEFSKWAKLNRRLDKLKRQHTEAKNKLTYEAIKFQLVASAIIYFFIYASLTLWAFFYRTSPVFFVPPGFSGPLDKLFGFPGAPSGSVSTFIWMFACKKVCGLLTRKVLKKDLEAEKQSQDQFSGGPLDIQSLFQATSTVLPPETQAF